MRFLVIGLGSIGTRHAQNLSALGHEVLGYDIKFLDGWASTVLYNDFKMINSPSQVDDIQGCIIATPSSQHDDDLNYVIARGWHTLVEKPIGDKITDTLISSVDFAKARGLQIMMGNNLRFHPSARLVKRYLTGGQIGKPVWAHICVAQFSDKPDYRRDGVTLNWGAHEIDLALWLFGPARVATASINKEDTLADICLVHDGGCRSVIHLDYLTQPELRQSVIMGDEGRLVMSLTGRYGALQRSQFSSAPEKQDGDFAEDYQREMIAFVNTVVDGKPWPGATGEDGLAALRIIDAAKHMAKNNGNSGHS